MAQPGLPCSIRDEIIRSPRILNAEAALIPIPAVRNQAHAASIRLGRIAGTMAMKDPRAALSALIEIFCEFWGSDASLGRLHDAAGLDPGFGQALAERNERRRTAIDLLIGRIDAGGAESAIKTRDAADLLFALTSFAMYRSLAADRSQHAICAVLKAACTAILDSMAFRRG
jgi:hypothetical protein